MAEKGETLFCTSPGILLELEGVLQRKKFEARLGKRKTTVSQIISSLYLLTEIYEPSERIELIPADPSDNMFLSCALTARVDYIISRDKHLLSLKTIRQIKIVTPEAFFKEMKKN